MRRTPLIPAVLLAALATFTIAAPAVADDDPALGQVISEDQPIVEEEATLDLGHVDMGPRFVDGEWTFLIHDDRARADAAAASVWRHPDRTVLQVADAAGLAVPDDPAYAFLGAEAGAEVYVVPQTQNPDVVWLGWNTQDPEVMSTIDRGMTLSLTGVQGPGPVTVFLQSGAFGEPEVLWDSRATGEQPIWVDVNTHTHANWVFSEPGVYLLQLVAQADLIDGTSVTDTQVLRVAVGSSTSPDAALAAIWAGGAPAAATAPPTNATDAAADALIPLVISGIVLGLALATVFIVMVARGSRARRRGLGDVGEAP